MGADDVDLLRQGSCLEIEPNSEYAVAGVAS
jgi:hypothetical protein